MVPAIVLGRMGSLIRDVGNTTLEHAFSNVLKLYAIARRQAELTSRDVFPNLHRPSPTSLARGAAGPIEGSLDLAEYFVRECEATVRELMF